MDEIEVFARARPNVAVLTDNDCDRLWSRIIGDPDDAAHVNRLDREVVVSLGVGEEPRSPAGPRRGLLVAAAAVALVGIGGVFAVANRSEPDPAGTVPPTSTPRAAVTSTNTQSTGTLANLPGSVEPGFEQCDDDGCSDFDPLPVVAGATDFYLAGEHYGDPTLHLDYFDNLTRCAELTDDGTSCARIEGIAAGALAEYSVDSGRLIEIGTTFATITPDQYAQQWGPTQGGDTITPLTIRGHQAVRYMNETRPAVVWAERPGVLVWVAVSPALRDQLATIAQDVRVTPGPTAVPHRVVVPGLGTPWDASDNDGDGVIVAVDDGLECVGYGYVSHCGTRVVDRIAVRTLDDGGMRVVGSTPPDVRAVNIAHVDGAVTDRTIEFPPYTSRFFAVEIPGERPLSIEWVNAAGHIVDQGPITGPAGLIPTDGGTLAIVDASAIRGRADELADALGDRGIIVSRIETSTTTVEQSMLMPTRTPTPWTHQLAELVGIGGFDTWMPTLIQGVLPAEVTEVIVLGADGGPELPLPLPTGIG